MASRTRKGPELTYFTTEKELLAIMWALQTFQNYLHGAEIINMMDHLALTFLKMCKFVNAQLSRWILAIQYYIIKVEHLPGKQNVMADVLSRLHDEESYKKNREKTRVIINALAYEWTPEIKNSVRNIPQQLKEDKRVQQLKHEITCNVDECARFKIIDNTLYHFSGTDYRIYVSTGPIKMLIKECHISYGHPGAEKTNKVLRENVGAPRKILSDRGT